MTALPGCCIEDEAKRKSFLIAILLSNIIIKLNTTTVMIALPTYMTIFQVDISTVQWVAVGYMLPLSMTMPLSGYFCERYSYRTVFLCGLAGIGLSSLGCSLSTSFTMLILFRFLKGIAGGLLIPCSMAMIYRYVQKEYQPAYLGKTVLFQSIGLTIGPTLAGFILQYANWHMLFFINVPLVAAALWMSYKNIPYETGNNNEKFDFIGILEVAFGTGIVLFAFSNVEDWGFGSFSFLGLIVLGLFLIAVFVRRQFHTAYPLLNFEVLKYKPFVLAILIQCTLSMTQGITGLLAQLYFQTVRGFTPAATGLFLLIPSLVMIVGNKVTVSLHKVGFLKLLITGGLAIAMVGNSGLAFASAESSIFILLVCFCLRYFGLGVIQMPLTNYGLCAVPKELSGHSSSMFNWSKQVAQVVSTNILTVVLSINLTKHYLANGGYGTPVEGTEIYNMAATQAINSDFFYLSVFLFISMVSSLMIKKQKNQE